MFSSDLRRARETAEVAFAHCPIPILLDWCLRECDYGEPNGSAAEVHVRDRRRYVDHPYPGGESWRQATARVARFLEDLPIRWGGSRVLVIGHVATRWALDHFLFAGPPGDVLDVDERQLDVELGEVGLAVGA